MCRSQLFAWSPVSPRDQTQVLRLDGKPLRLLSHLTGPLSLFWSGFLTLLKVEGCGWSHSLLLSVTPPRHRVYGDHSVTPVTYTQGPRMSPLKEPQVFAAKEFLLVSQQASKSHLPSVSIQITSVWPPEGSPSQDRKSSPGRPRLRRKLLATTKPAK